MIYGTRAVMEAVIAGKEFDRLFVQKNIDNVLSAELLDLLRKHSIQYSKVPVEKLNRLTRKNHQGIVGFISAISYSSLDNVVSSAYAAGESPLILILDRITDVRNFGAICRSAECAGVHAIVVPIKGSAQVNSDAMKTSAGALNYIPVCRENSLENAIRFLQDNGLRVVACTEKTDTTIYKIDLSGPLAIILGSEEDGIMPQLLKKADALGRVPMSGRISSLNVSVAAGILVFEALRQRNL
jgi:23S rRNA (guanosine2251-2'-O)-methyltransferase